MTTTKIKDTMSQSFIQGWIAVIQDVIDIIETEYTEFPLKDFDDLDNMIDNIREYVGDLQLKYQTKKNVQCDDCDREEFWKGAHYSSTLVEGQVKKLTAPIIEKFVRGLKVKKRMLHS
ncbi:MAG: hypothetical protein ACXADY_13025 [Candidatus Hodarchaeales archaeon]